MIPADLAGRRVAVLGVGIDVAAVLPVVVAAGPAALVVVDAAPERARATLRRIGVEADVLDDLVAAPPVDVALRSPGFSPYRPAVAGRVGAGMVTITPLGLWLSARGDRPSVAITGTKGKSSTSVLTAAALERLGRPAAVLGNIGVPPWERSPATDLVPVLEVSSYQALDLPVTAPYGALTALAEDHVDWHGGVERYLRDKARVFTAPGGRWAGRVAGAEPLPPPFDRIGFTVVPAPAGDLRAANARLAAATALAVVGSEPDDGDALDDLAAALLEDYPELPGRFSTVAVAGAVEFIDDALASAPLGLAAALATVGDRAVAAIVGGTDRGADLDPVLAAIARRRAPTTVVLIDDARSPAVATRYAAAAPVVEADDLEAAVATAAAVPGVEAVLFAPGMPTPAPQGNWSDRSRRFRAAVAALTDA